MFELNQFSLPFKNGGLEPFMSAKTIEFHYGKHLDTYIKNLNGLIGGTEMENLPLVEIIKKSDGKAFNNAAQVFNHDFFFKGLALDNGAKFPKILADAFGGMEKFAAEFRAAAVGIFGSGWAWLSRGSDGKFLIETMANADTPLVHGRAPILALDVWEHAYYLDYQNRRADFADAFLAHLINWDVISERIM
ncbi:MAG: superoxide dismutase [Rickettsiales bacterium]|jgi:Fe-Mn family superoxide dismutase|nr:superoxide dismutase [Rickettsiales bacterium]